MFRNTSEIHPTIRGLQLPILIILAAILVSWGIGWAVTRTTISYRQAIAFVLVVLSVLSLAAGVRGLRAGFLLWILTLGLGYRTFHLTPSLSLHPSELLLSGLCVMVLISAIITPSARPRFWLPWWLWAFVPFWIIGLVLAAAAGRPVDLVFAEFRNFLLLIPLFLVTEFVLQRKQDWDNAILMFFAMSVWVGGIGVLEYLAPDVLRPLPGFVASNPEVFVSEEGFTRASFSFWGSIDAVFLCGIGLPFGWVTFRRCQHDWQRILAAAGTALLFIAIYISGHRNLWLVLVAVLFGFVWFRSRSVVGVLLTSGALAFAFRFLPESARERLLGSFAVFTGSYADASMIDRVSRIQQAIASIRTSPFGRGWTSAGWVHNDYLQVTANLGVLAGGVFLIAVVSTLAKLWRRLQPLALDKEHDIGLALLLAFGTAAGLMGLDAMIVLPQLILGPWCAWVLAEVWLHQNQVEAG